MRVEHASIKVTGKMGSKRAKVCWKLTTVICMRARSSRARNSATESASSPVVSLMTVNGSMIRCTVRVSNPGSTAANTQGSSTRIKWMAKVYLNMLTETDTKVNSKMIKEMEPVNTPRRTAISMLATGKMVSRRDMVLRLLTLVQFTKDSSQMTRDTAMENSALLTVRLLRATLSTAEIQVMSR